MLYVARSVIVLFAFAILLAYLINPVVRFLQRHSLFFKNLRGPHVLEWDETQHFPLDVFKKLGEIGVLGAVFPEELGGSGYSYVDYSIIMEELARVDPSVVGAPLGWRRVQGDRRGGCEGKQLQPCWISPDQRRSYLP